MTLFGYARVSTVDQDLGIQEAALRAAGCQTIRSEKKSGTERRARTELQILLDFLRSGDTLVVTTKGFRGDGWLDVRGTPFTEGLTLTERFRRVNYGRLEIDLTIDDPKAYTKPWTVRVNHRLSPSDQLIEFICNENEKSSKHYVR